MALHVVADFYGVKPDILKRVEDLKPKIDEIINRSGLKSIKDVWHQFEPHGVSCVYLLRESHVSLHTWPEDGYVAIDLYYCGKEQKRVLDAYEMLYELFKPSKVIKNVITRPVPSEDGSPN